MAKFIELTGYFSGYAEIPTKRIVNLDRVQYVEKYGSDENKTGLHFSSRTVMVINGKFEDISKLFSK